MMHDVIRLAKLNAYLASVRDILGRARGEIHGYGEDTNALARRISALQSQVNDIEMVVAFELQSLKDDLASKAKSGE